MKNLISKTIKNYQILLKIRESSTTILYKAFDQFLDRYVALEILKPTTLDHQILYEQLKPIVKKNSILSHPNIGTILDYFIEDELVCLVYNFHPIHTIKRYFNRSYSWKATSTDLVTIAQALTYAHDKGVIHGFVNPHNIIINEKGAPILFGFEVEIFLIQYYSRILPGSWINNIGEAYLAPEVLIKNDYSMQSDIYSFGILMHEWLTGEYLYVGETPLLTVYLRSSQKKEKHLKNKYTNPEIKLIVEKCIHHDSKHRYQSIQEISVLLARGALDYKITKEMAKAPLKYKTPQKRPSKFVLTFFCFLFAFIIFVAGFYYQFLSNAPEKQFVSLPADSTPEMTPTFQFTPTVNENSPLPSRTPTLIPTEKPKPTLTFNQISFPIRDGEDIPKLFNMNIETNNAERIIQVANWGIGEVNHLEVSSDRSMIGIATALGVEIYDPYEFRRIAFLDTSTRITTIAFSNNNNLIAVGDKDGVIQLWDTITWKPILFLSEHRKGIMKLFFSEDDQFLYSLSADETIKKWDIEKKIIAYQFSENTTYVSDMAVTPDGHYLITVGKNNKIQFWNLTTYEYVKNIRLPSQIFSVVVTPDSKQVVVGCADHRVYIIDIQTEEIYETLDGLNYDIVKLILTPDGGIIAGDQLGGIAYWDSSYSLQWKANRPEGSINRVDLLSSGSQLVYLDKTEQIVSIDWQGITRIFDKNSGKQIDTPIDFYNKPVNLKISPNDNYIAVQNDKKQVRVWSLLEGKVLFDFEGELVFGNPFSPNSQFIALKINDSTVRVYGIRSGKTIYQFNGHGQVKTIDYGFDGDILVVGKPEDLHLWSLLNGQEIVVTKNFSTSGCTQIYDLNDNVIMFITNYNLKVPVSDSSSGLCEFGRVGWMRAMDVNMTKKIIAVGGNSRLIVHNYEFSSDDINIEGVNLKNVMEVAIHPSGDIVASALNDFTIRLWDINTKEELVVLFGHKDEITDLEFTSNGRFLVSSSRDGFIKIWGVP
ncbi:MAG: hypothetical protein CL609_10680 [Anaerolineaceae bacterium]|nr:hypothetical protein [Anaerolineaceae bacterium]